MKIILNGRKTDADGEMSYDALVGLAKLTGHPTLTFKDRESGRGGTVHTGQVLKLAEGMVINIIHTGNG